MTTGDRHHDHKRKRVFRCQCGKGQGRRLIGLLLGASLLLAGSCARQAETQAVAAGTNHQALTNVFERSQVDVGLDARLAQTGRLQVTLKNKTNHPLEIDPVNFAVIPPGRHEVIPADPVQSKSLFPTLTLAAGEEVSGELVFPPDSATKGARLVFKSDQAQPAMARIE